MARFFVRDFFLCGDDNVFLATDKDQRVVWAIR